MAGLSSVLRRPEVAARRTESRGPCICDGKKHWRGTGKNRILRTNWKNNPYCEAHESK